MGWFVADDVIWFSVDMSNVMSQSHRIKGGASDEVFRSSVICRREELLGWLVQSLIFLTGKYKTVKERNKMKM